MFVKLQTSGERDEAPEVRKFAKGDVVEIMGVEDGEEEQVVGIGKVINLEGAKLHGVTLEEGCVSVEVQKSNNDDYLLYACVELDDPPITEMGAAVGSFIKWPTRCLRALLN